MLALPFGDFHSIVFCNAMATPGGTEIEIAHAVSVLVPFVLGFGWWLVMLVLNRLVQGVETVFGIRRGQAGQG